MEFVMIRWLAYIVLGIIQLHSTVVSDFTKSNLERGFQFGELHVQDEIETSLVREKRQKYLLKSPHSPENPSESSAQPAECGINGKSKGLAKPFDSSSAHDWPWMAVLLNRNYHNNFCGGVLLNKNYVLTAAHCVEKRKAKQILVRLGEYDFTLQNDTRHSEFGVVDIKIHKDYSSTTYQHDIALLKLNKQVKYTNSIRPICLPTAGIVMKPNQTAIVAGWGAIFYGGVTSSVLLEVSVPIWDLKNCISKYVPPVFDTNICAAGYKGNKDSCVGDSGGPLVIQLPNGRWTNVGIVSWGMACGDKDHPGVYTKVASYLDWIKNHTRDAQI